MVPLIISLDTFRLTSESLSLYKGTTFAYGPLVPQEFLFSGTVLSRVSFPCPSRRWPPSRSRLRAAIPWFLWLSPLSLSRRWCLPPPVARPGLTWRPSRTSGTCQARPRRHLTAWLWATRLALGPTWITLRTRAGLRTRRPAGPRSSPCWTVTLPAPTPAPSGAGPGFRGRRCLWGFPGQASFLTSVSGELKGWLRPELATLPRWETFAIASK